MKTKSTRLTPTRCLRQQGFRDALQRLTMTLMLVMLTAMTAWAASPERCLDACVGGMELIHIEGWAYDPDAPSTSIDVHVYVYKNENCTAKYGGIRKITANVPRPDVNQAMGITGNHGFNVDIPIADAGTYWVKVYAMDTSGYGNPQIGSTTKVTVTGLETVTIGDSPHKLYIGPFRMDHNYSLNEQIYTAEEINMEGTITSIAFNYCSSLPFSMSDVQVYLKHTDKNNFSDWSMVPLSAEDKVFEGTFSASGEGWVTIELDTPFEYDGISNLLVCTFDPTNGSFVGEYNFGFHMTSGRKWFIAYSNNTVPSLDGSNSGAMDEYGFINFRNQIRFNIYPGTFSRPDNLTVSSCTEEEATLTWTAPETVNPIMGYAYQFKKASDADWSDEVTTTGTTATFSNLTADTDYNFRVRTIYGSRKSIYQTLTFTTATPLPYEQGFENGMGHWGMVDINWGNTGINNRANHNGEYGFQFESFISGEHGPQYLISPRFSGDKGLRVSFYHYTIGSAGANFKIGYSTTSSDPTAFTWEEEITPVYREWNRAECVFPQGTRFVAIRFDYVDETYAHGLFLDDFSFEEYSAYAKPTAIGTKELTETKAMVIWNNPDQSVTSFVYQYKKSDETTWSAEATIYANYVTLENLTPNTSYNFRVKALYGSNASNYATYTFLTDANIVDLPYTDGFENGMGGWRMKDCNGKTEVIKAGYPHNGSYCFGFWISDQHQFLNSPHFAGGTPIKVSFYYQNFENYFAEFMVGYTSSKDVAVTWVDNVVTASDGAWHLYETTLPAETQYFVICCRSEGNMLYLDDFSFTYEPASVTFAKEGYGTYYNGSLDAVMPAGVKARIVTAKGDGNTLTYETIADGDQIAATSAIVPKATAVMLQTAASTSTQNIDIPLASPTDTRDFSTTNYLHGSDTQCTTTGDGKHYKLSYNQSGENLGWYWGAADGAAFESAAHKAWLVLPNTNAREFFGLPGDETTGVGSIDNEQFTIHNEAGAWYSLDGRKLSGEPSAKGIYVKNGKKIVIK